MARPKGSKNKAVIEREAIARDIAARTITGAQTSGRELAKEKLEKFTVICEGAAAIFRPPDGGVIPKGSIKNWKTFGEWMDRAIWCAAQLAKYQSPTFRAVAVNLEAPQPVAPPTIDNVTGKVIDFENDIVALQARYQRMIRSAG